MSLILLLVVTLALAAANGANDNIKGAATLVGSGVIRHRGAIALATLATAAGGVASIFLANGLLLAFSGKGIVPQDITTSLPFLLAVGTGAAMTIWLATWTGMPVSTTHALLGGLLGAGASMVLQQVAVGAAFKAMLAPLLISPLVALVFALALVPLLRRLRTPAPQGEPCICSEVEVASAGSAVAAIDHAVISMASEDAPQCQPAPGRSVTVLPVRRWLDNTHLLSAAAVSFARGLNDTPKIAALAVAGSSLGVGSASLGVVTAMAVGGLLASRKVADTLAYKVTRMDPGEGLGGNLVTAALVMGASHLGMPVSTTHVSTGALFGVAASNGTGQAAMIRQILLAWCFTLPVAGLLAFGTATAIS